MERGARRISLTLAGQPAPDPAAAAYVLDVYQLSKMTTAGKQRLRAGIRTGEKTFCRNAIAPEHVQKAWDNSTQALKLSLVSRKGSPLSVGFALVRKRGSKLYVHLLCAETSDKAKTRSGYALLDPSPGALLLSQLEALGRKAGVASLELSAVPYVINYYRKHGFRHLSPGATEEKPAVAAAAETVRQHRFKNNNELGTAYAIGEAAIDAAKAGAAGAESLAERLEWAVPSHSFRVAPDGKIVAYDDRERVDVELTEKVARRGEYSDMVEAFMRLRDPTWDRARDEVELVTDETFPMAKRIGEGRRATRRGRRRKGTGRGRRRRTRRGKRN